ncbi:MAG: hypothetical protein VKO21_03690 [Candidatus Sericytochromatia bacterium]|nr:hypothetical protein [Candidatus Sericytochromatia bacterium]
MPMPALPSLANWLSAIPFLRRGAGPIPAAASAPAPAPLPRDRVKLSTRDDLRQQLQRQLDQEIGGTGPSGYKSLVRKRPDLIDAASPEQRARLISGLLGRNGGNPDREGIQLVMAPAAGKGEDGVLSESLARVGKRAQLFRAMGDQGPGLDLARFALRGGWFEEIPAVDDAGLPGVRAAMRVATDRDLINLPNTSKSKMISVLQAAPFSDENDLMVMRIRRFMDP